MLRQGPAAPPPAASALRKAIAALKQRRPTPTVQHLQGSREDFRAYLLEVRIGEAPRTALQHMLCLMAGHSRMTADHMHMGGRSHTQGLQPQDSSHSWMQLDGTRISSCREQSSSARMTSGDLNSVTQAVSQPPAEADTGMEVYVIVLSG